MQLVDRETGLYRTTFRTSVAGRDDFQILRDNDNLQSLHAPFRLCNTLGVPAKGPDDMGEGKNWAVAGKPGEDVCLELCIKDGPFTVTIRSPSQMTMQWKSAERRHDYYVAGSFNNWTPTCMTPDRVTDGVYRYQALWSDFEAQDFQIVVDNDPSQVMFPASAGASSAGGLLLGPSDGGDGKHWQIVGWPGRVCEIELDLTQEDRRKMVQWKQLMDDNLALDGYD